MKFTPVPYQLAFKGSFRPPRQGALLRVEFEEGSIGYADCHPWESLGDLPLSEQLHLLREGKLTALTSRTLHFARLDAEARGKGINLFTALAVPKNHFLIVDLRRFETEDIKKLLQQGFERLKIKLGEALLEESQLLKKLLPSLEGTACRVRLDFNNRLSQAQFEAFLIGCETLLQRIEFCEDPFPYESAAWKQVQERFGIALACDQGSERAIGSGESAAVIVVKPAVQDERVFLKVAKSQKIVVTSYLDHPLGQMSAAYAAGWLNQQLPQQVITCGLLSHQVYSPTPYSLEWSCHGPQFLNPAGTGFGFDRLLCASG